MQSSVTEHPDGGFRLKRSLTLTQMILYGVGTTVGAGIYALVGEIAGVAGYGSPWAFLLASALAAFTAVSFAQLAKRYPRAAGTALYVQQGFNSEALARVVGLFVIVAGVVSSAALINGFFGYLTVYVDADRVLAIALIAVVLFLVAAWGISESVWVAGLISLVEVGGLVWIIYLGGAQLGNPDAWSQLTVAPSWSSVSVILTGAVLAFYAYIGFEDMVEVAEEVNDVERNLPRAILITLGVTTLIYFLLITTALFATTPERLAGSQAPLAELYRALTDGGEPIVISMIGLFAIINGALIQIIMASRVIYGLANRGQMPAFLARVNQRTQIPVIATALASALVCALAMAGSLVTLAEVTSTTMLAIFAAVNFALWQILRREAPSFGHSLLKASAICGGVVCTFLAVRTIVGWL
jgi:amino acid transporter